MAGIFSQGGSAGHRYAGWLSEVEAKNFTFGGKVFNGSPSAIYVGSNQVWPWLTIAAQQAIRGAFGQRDGMAVINATNAYLNQLAASGQAGKDKATALAGWLNTYAVEDAHIVYSLVPTLGVLRYIHGGYTEQVSTGIVPTTTMVINAKFRMNSVTQYHPAFQQGYISEQAMTTRCIADNGATNRLIFALCGKTGGGKSVTVTFDYNVSGKWMDIQMDDTQVKVNGTTYAFSGSDRGSENTNPIYLLGRGDNYGATDIDFQLFETIDGNSKHTFVPYKVGNTCYILDLVTGNKIAGSFTISETPSTP